MKITSATLTAVTPDGYPVTIPFTLDEGERITDAVARLTGQLSRGGWEPPQQAEAAAESGGSFPAERMVCTVDKGQAYWKVIGGEFQKFGLSIWPEAMIASGLDPEAMNPMKPVDLTGWTAHFVTKNGKAKKVIRLEKN